MLWYKSMRKHRLQLKSEQISEFRKYQFEYGCMDFHVCIGKLSAGKLYLFGAYGLLLKKWNWNKYELILKKTEFWVRENSAHERENAVKTNMTVITRKMKTCKWREEINGSSTELI